MASTADPGSSSNGGGGPGGGGGGQPLFVMQSMQVLDTNKIKFRLKKKALVCLEGKSMSPRLRGSVNLCNFLVLVSFL